MKKKWNRSFISALFLCVLFFGTGCKKGQEVYLEEKKEIISEEKESSGDVKKKVQTEKIFVYVCGAVEKPGVYELGKEERICDAIKAAGGLKETAAAESLNQAEKLSDGQMVRVLTLEEQEMQKSQEAESEDGRININTADVQKLTSLPGIGASKAEAIIAYREEHGRFQSVEELMKISGIKEGTYRKIKDSITVD
ncbi:MAG: competence protein ComEA [Lachnospiraceae bacterium]|nr:competence protein ComEA [Lachnospiraceae bacterium]